MKSFLPLLRAKLFILGFVFIGTAILANNYIQRNNLFKFSVATENDIDDENKSVRSVTKKSESQRTSELFTATVTSDKPDYAPLSTAIFTGDGFGANEEVILKVKNLNQPCNTVTADSSYLPWTVTTDDNGHFETTWTVCNCPGDSLRLRAVGLTSRDTAYAYFTDALPVDNDLIITGLSSSGPFCRGSQFYVYYTSGNTGDVYGSGNVFSVQLGNGGGNWPNSPDVIGTATVSQSGSGPHTGQILVTIPTNYNGVGSAHNLRMAASNPLIGGADFATEIVIENPPQDYNVTGGGAYCPDVNPNGVTVGLQDSEAPFVQNNTTYYFSYQLYLTNSSGTVPIGSPILGTGNAISFGNQTQAGTYTVIATNGRTTCTAVMKGNAVITSALTAPTLTPIPLTTSTVCEGNSVKADVGPGTGGSGTIVDHVEYRQNTSSTIGTWLPYTDETPISTTGFVSIDIRSWRTASNGACNTSPTNMITWTIDANPPVFTGDYSTVGLGCNPGGPEILGALGSATATDGCGTPTVSNGIDGAITSTDCQRSQTRTFTATDAGGKTTTVSRTVTWIADVTAATFTGSYSDVDLGCNPANPSGSLGSATATDACGAVTITHVDGGIVSTGCNRSVTRTFTAEDGCHNSSTQTRTVRWIADITAATFTGSYSDVDLGCNPANPSGSLGSATATDACGSVTITHVDGSIVSTGCNRSVTRTFTAEDGCHNSSTQTRTVTWIADVTAATFTGSYSDVDLGCNPANPSGSLGSATATDACGSVTITHVDGSIVSTGCNRSVTRTFTAEDGCHNSSTQTRTVRWIADVTAATFTGSYSDVDLGCNPANPSGSLGSATATDACGAVTITHVDGGIVSTGCNRSVTRTFTAEDGCHNSSTQTRTVRWIADVTAATFTGSYSDVDLGCNPANPSGSLGSATATDACGAVTITHVDGSIVSTGCNRSVTRTFTAEDGCHNSSTQTRTVRWIADITAATFTGSYSDVDLGCNPANPSGSLGSATATDACGSVTITHVDGSIVSTGCNRSVTRTFIAEDGCHNSSTQTRTVRWIADITAATFTGSYSDVDLGCNPANPSGSLGSATATDACGSVTITHVDGSIVSTGCNRSVTRTFTAEDGCHNSSTQTRTVTWIADVTAATFTGSYSDVDLGCNPANPSGSLGSATATDACGSVTITHVDGSIVSTGCNRSVTRTFTAEDGCHNSSTQTRTVRWIADVTAATFTGSYSDVDLGCNPANPSGSLGSATATDACGAVTITHVDGGIVSTGCNRSVTRTFTAEDGCHNSSTQTRTVRWIADVTAATFTGSYSDVDLGCNPANPSGSLGSATATDACGSVTITHVDGGIVSTGCNRSVTRTFTAEDGCHNSSTQTRTVRWIADITAATFTGSYSDVDLGCNPANPSGSLGSATATDACGSVTITHVDGSIVSTGCNRSVTRTFTAEDGCHNSSTQTRTVRWIADVTPATFTGSYTSVPLGCNPSESDITGALGTATATDACGSVTITHIDGAIASTGCGRSQKRTFTAKDGCSNTSTICRVVTWTYDVTPPSANNVTSGYKCADEVPIPNPDVILGESDNCNGPVSVDYIAAATTNNGGAGCASSPLVIKRYYKLTDGCSNSSTVSHTITVIDDVAPTLVKQNIERTLGTGGSVTITAADINNGSSDNCDDELTLALDKYTFTDAEIGTASCSRVFTVKLTATDDCNNTSTCNATVTIHKRKVLIDYTGDNTEQYSDSTDLKAVVTDELTGDPLIGKTISFVIGTQSTSAVTNGSGVASIKMRMHQNAGDYDVTASYAGDGPYCTRSVTEDYDILQENALTDYTGPEIVGDACTSCGTTSVLLSASIKDTVDGMPGDIRKARVKFYIIGGADCSGWLTPGLVSPGDTTAGIVTFNWTAPLPSTGYTTYDIGVKVDYNPSGVGNYIGYAQGVVTIYRLSLNEFITGGGHIIPTVSNGSYASTPGRKVNFGFNVKWNKSNKNLQGNMNIIFRRNNRVYQIKTNAMNTLSIVSTDPCSKKATFVSKANLNDVTDPNVPPSLVMGNLTLTATMTDNGEPGNNDKIGITVYSGNTLIYSSNWVSTQTAEMLLNGGNVVVHNGVVCPNNNNTRSLITQNVQREVIPEIIPFNVKAFPNPTGHQFTLYLEGATNEKVHVTVYDAIGRQVKIIEKESANIPIRFGMDLIAGVYIVEVKQGDNRKTLKLVKQ